MAAGSLGACRRPPARLRTATPPPPTHPPKPPHGPPLAPQSYPELIPHLSSCKSPQMMMGAVVKRYWAPKMGLKPEDICLVG